MNHNYDNNNSNLSTTENEKMDKLTFHLVVEMAAVSWYFCSTQMNLAHTKHQQTLNSIQNVITTFQFYLGALIFVTEYYCMTALSLNGRSGCSVMSCR